MAQLKPQRPAERTPSKRCPFPSAVHRKKKEQGATVSGRAGGQGKVDPSVATDGKHGARQGRGAKRPHGAALLPPHHAHCCVPAPQALTSCTRRPHRVLRSQLISNLVSLPPPAPSVRLLQAAKPDPGMRALCPHQAAPSLSPAPAPSRWPNHTRCKVPAPGSSEQQRQQPEQRRLFPSLPSRSLPSAGDERAPGPAQRS